MENVTEPLACSGTFENPWFCNLPVFNYNPVCHFPFALKWNYDIESHLLNIDIFNKNGAPKNLSKLSTQMQRLAGLVQVHVSNNWFYKPNVLLNETFNWHEANNSTKIVKIDEDHYQMRQLITPEEVKCARIGLLMFGNQTKENTSHLLFRSSLSNEICAGHCDRIDVSDSSAFESFHKVGKYNLKHQISLQ